MKKIIIFLLSAFIILTSLPAQAALLNSAKKEEMTFNFKATAWLSQDYSFDNTLEGMIGGVIRIVLSLVGSVFIILIIIAGINWMRAEGNQEEINKSKATIKNLVIGLIIIIAAYALSYGLSNILAKAIKS